jgi:very-short-patch-repair endonuclease
MESIAGARTRKAGVSSPASDRAICARFLCAKACLAVEIDGANHDMGGRPQYDIRRDACLQARGVTVLRIAAKELAPSIDEAADVIVRMAAELL